MPEVKEIVLVKLPKCSPCEIVEHHARRVSEQENLPLKVITAKPIVGREAFLLVCGDSREEVQASTIPGFPLVWLSYKDGSNSNAVVGAQGPDWEDPVSFLLKAVK